MGIEAVQPAARPTMPQPSSNPSRALACGAVTVLLPALAPAQAILIGSHQGSDPGGRLGAAVVPLGDVDGDGRTEIVCGAPDADDAFLGTTDCGIAHFDYGQPVSVLSGAWQQLTALSSVWPGVDGQHLGAALAALGDVTGDGIPDVAVGAPGDALTVGRVYLFSGALGTPGTHQWSWTPSAVDSEFGAAIARLGDVDGDGVGDLAVGAPRAQVGSAQTGAVWVLSGAKLQQTGVNPVIHWFPGFSAGDEFGRAVAGIGDVDLDGVTDLAVGAPFAGSADEGVVFVYSCGSAGALWNSVWGSAGSRFGWSVASLGDVDGDGWSEIVVGAPKEDPGGVLDGGSAYVVSGLYLSQAVGAQTVWSASGGSAGAEFGFSVAGVGDFDQDSLPDVAIGAPAPAGVGVAFVNSGASGAFVLARGGSTGQQYGYSVAAGGDTNGDGRPELLVGWPGFGTGGRAEVLTLPPVTPVSYCTSKVNSLGCRPVIVASGYASLAQPVPFHVTALDALNKKNGLLFYGYFAKASSFQGGTLCVALPIVRTSVQNSGGSASGSDCSGTFDFQAYLQGGQDPVLVAGAEIGAQYWYRDPGSMPQTGLSDALRILICP